VILSGRGTTLIAPIWTTTHAKLTAALTGNNPDHLTSLLTERSLGKTIYSTLAGSSFST